MLYSHTDVTFRKRYGTIIRKDGGETSHFIKRAGVYFIKLRVKRSLAYGDDDVPPMEVDDFADQDSDPMHIDCVEGKCCPILPFGKHGNP